MDKQKFIAISEEDLQELREIVNNQINEMEKNLDKYYSIYVGLREDEISKAQARNFVEYFKNKIKKYKNIIRSFNN